MARVDQPGTDRITPGERCRGPTSGLQAKCHGRPVRIVALTWSTALSRGLERVAETILGTAALARRRQADAIDLSPFPVFGRVRIELATMLLLEPRALARAKGPPILIVGPYAVHDASIADFAEGYSLAQVLTEAGLGFIGLTFWKSATAEMRDYGIDAYLSDLNVAIDDLGGRASLVGLCQGGWLAAAYAARFPGKVAKLVLVGAPIDLAAAESGITRALAAVSQATLEEVMALAGGWVSGPLSLALCSGQLSGEFSAEAALQCVGDAALVARFDDWNARTVDLPGAYFLQTAEWVFRENWLARGCFPALGRLVRLSNITRRSSSSRRPTTRSSPCRRPRRSRLCVAQPTSSFALSRGGTLAIHGAANTWRRLARHRRLAQAKGRRRRVTIRRCCRVAEGGAGRRVEFADQVQFLSRGAAACETHATGLAMRLTYIPSPLRSRAPSSRRTSINVASVSSSTDPRGISLHKPAPKPKSA